MCIREPAADGNGVLRVEDVGRRRVVDDDRFLEVTSDLGKVLARRLAFTFHQGSHGY